MFLSVVAVLVGLSFLVWSADKFVDGAVGVARFLGMSTLLIGMVVVGFGTSAPEMVVSALSAAQHNPELALGNAYGSNIANIALILGFTAVVRPVVVKNIALKRDLPVLMVVTAFSIFLVSNLSVTRMDGVIMLAVFALAMGINVVSEMRQKKALVSAEVEEKTSAPVSLWKSLFWLLLGLAVLVASSRLLVWGAVEIARALGVSDLLIGLTIVAVGTSLPELASSIAAARKGEDDLAFGNIVGSNLFNTLMVVGIAAVIDPMERVSSSILYRDMPLMSVLTVLLFVFGLPVRKVNGVRRGRINRIEGSVFVVLYISYLVYLVLEATGRL
ncbi:MAG: calcium/sodium antiporter [Fibrobacter sp.]|nr:calcium/sodium antiporter [Fibrobacter sp.]